MPTPAIPYDAANPWSWPFEPYDPLDDTLIPPRHWQQVPSGLATSATRADIERADVEIQCIHKRIEGKSYARIAYEMGWVSKRTGKAIESMAQRAVTKGLRRWAQEPAEELRQLEAARLDEIQERIWPIIMTTGGKGADDRALRAVDRYMQISNARAKLFGLDAPQKVQAQINARIEHSLTEEASIERVEILTEYLSTVEEVLGDQLARASSLPALTSEQEEDERARDDDVVDAEIVE